MNELGVYTVTYRTKEPYQQEWSGTKSIKLRPRRSESPGQCLRRLFRSSFGKETALEIISPK